jgi:hypothetical protein
MTYNLTTKGEQVRIGNWFEELKLKKETGIRFYPDPKDKANSLLTFSRVIEHTEQVLPQNYASTIRQSYTDPRLHKNYKKDHVAKGPRQQRLEKQLMDEVMEETKAKERSDFTETRRVNYETTNSAAYNKITTSMKETSAQSRLSNQPPITFYSYSISTPNVPIAFPTTFVGSSVHPFAKSGAFSADTRHHTLSVRSETYERPKSLPNMLEYRSLNSLKASLVANALSRFNESLYANDNGSFSDGRTIRHIADTLWMHSNDGKITIDELTAVLHDTYGVDLNDHERRALVASFDKKSNGFLSTIDIHGFIRGVPSERRLEMLHLVYSMLDPENTGLFYCDPTRNGSKKLVSAFLEATSDSSSDAAREVNIHEFYNFYYDASGEIGEDDSVFEKLLYETWAN